MLVVPESRESNIVRATPSPREAEMASLGLSFEMVRPVLLFGRDGMIDPKDHGQWYFRFQLPDGRFAWQHKTDLVRLIVENPPYGNKWDRIMFPDGRIVCIESVGLKRGDMVWGWVYCVRPARSWKT